MSFSGTPLGQGRRLDHRTFLNRQNPNTNHNNPRTVNPPTSPQRIIPTSYAYGAPTAATRSPPKPLSANSTQELGQEGNTDEPALVRYAHIKQREQTTHTRPSAQLGPRTITSPPRPEKWSVKDTSVNIATAFLQAASSSHEMQSNNPNHSWASGSQTNLNVPRSTSVEYEKETQSISNRRLAPPPNRLSQRSNRIPLSKQVSVTQVPDSEGEDEAVDENGRAKTPFEQVVDITKRVLAPATFYLRQRSQEPADHSNVSNGKDSSYDYSAEEREYQEMQGQKEGEDQNGDQDAKASSRRINATHKRNRMSMDNKAYRPSVSEMEESEDDLSDDGKKRRRRAKKKELGGGPLTTLPVASYGKRRRRKGRGSNRNLEEIGEEEQEGSSSGNEQRSAPQRTSIPRGSAPPSVRGSIPPVHETSQDESMDVEAGLQSIPEIDEPPVVDGYMGSQPVPARSKSFSIGGLLGKLVNRLWRGIVAVLHFLLDVCTAVAMLAGKVLGTIVDVILRRPADMVSRTNPGPFVQLGKYLMVALSVYAAWYALRDPFLQWIPSRISGPPTYYAPDTPITDFTEFTARLQNIESALSGLSLDHQRSRSQLDVDARSNAELINRIFALEARVKEEIKRSVEAQHLLQAATSRSLQEVREEMEAVQSHVQEVEAHPRESVERHAAEVSDEEARGKLKVLEERLGTVEGGVKEALELGKNSVRLEALQLLLSSGSATGSGITIKSSDGHDVTSLIGHLVESAVLKYSQQDDLSRPDFALHSAGARLIPSLTSQTLTIYPATLGARLYGLVSGQGTATGRTPVTVLHHEVHNGYCWPMEGTKGSVGVMLAYPAYVSDFTIDHVSKEVAFDLRSAPRDMEVWGFVDGKDNLAKVREWQADKAKRREEARRIAEEEGLEYVEESEPEYPSMLPTSEPYIRIASFTYDIYSSRNIQTFPVSQEIKDLGIDFGVVVLVINNNWGRDEFTCIYRFRVHGELMGEMALPYPEETSES
ncbi:hypothetical protein SERLADRAFT_449028 [Serpula lacrymans var. lacrymans S7.9]|uniref:SUN domain-containing protein n=1 Tax=Serpula lacrymans var. lacrymans (strain S7.9) TaxID=578457 RepID=F8NVV0_SERL9|nr:uncharacterized protein SERLADRAFT_449028 [Serpula lacrymans var. lacrymans S7.9]EGO24261.1 hypothetical protein SERLADRAFT_449028 [Serpula lacrymans var. lacrymans S7.9]